jgi:hypothetical protein
VGPLIGFLPAGPFANQSVFTLPVFVILHVSVRPRCRVNVARCVAWFYLDAHAVLCGKDRKK